LGVNESARSVTSYPNEPCKDKGSNYLTNNTSMPGHFYPLRELYGFAPKIVWALLFTIVVLAGFYLASRPVYTDADFRVVAYVINGNTLVMENGQRVRLIGVDTPETRHSNRSVGHFGKEATALIERLVKGKRVRLQFDFSQGQRDRYGHTLAYAFLESGVLLNAEIIRHGYGFVYTRSPFARVQEFRELEREAREQRRGLWRVP
jgi:micrococcal nuclease